MGKRKKKDDRNDYLIFKNKLTSVCADENVLHKLLNFTERSSIITRHTCMFIRCYFNYLFELKQPFPKVDSMLIGNIRNCISTITTKFKHDVTNIEKFHKDHFSKLHLQYASRDNMTQMLTYETTQIITHIETNIKTHFIQHFTKYIKIMFDYKRKLLNLYGSEAVIFKRNFYELKSYILNSTCENVFEEHKDFANYHKSLLFPFQTPKSVNVCY